MIASDTSLLPEVVDDATLVVAPWNPKEIVAAGLKVLEDGKLQDALQQKGLEST